MKFSVGIVGGLLLIGAVRAVAEPPSSAKNAFSAPDVIEVQVFDLVNDARRKEGLPELSWDAKIARLARAHSQAMATTEINFGHSGFSDRMLELRQSFPRMREGGENVFMTSISADSAKQAVRGWLLSPPHRKNILSQDNLTGIGLAVSPQGSIYFTQIFILNAPEKTTQTE